MQGVLGAKFNASLSSKAAAASVAARSGATVLRPSAPTFVAQAPANLARVALVAASASAVADAPAPAVSSSERGSQPATPRRTIAEAACLFRFVLPAAAMGALMGQGGEHIAAINAATGCFVQVSRPGTAVFSERERMVTIAGPDVAACAAAFAAALTTISEQGAEERLRRPVGRGAPGIFVRMAIPATSAGKVLGPGGETIAALSAASRASVVVEAKPKHAAFVPFRFVNVLAPDVGAAAAAAAAVMALVVQDERYAAAVRDLVSVAFKVAEVPEGRVGAIMGPAGAHVQALQDMLRVKVGIADAEAGPGGRRGADHKAVRYVSVWGGPANVRVALDAIAIATGQRLPAPPARGSSEAAGASRAASVRGDE